MEQLATKTIRLVKSSVICIALTISISAHANTKIGHVIFSSGDIKATQNGESRSLKRGSQINEGDVIKSGRYTRSQLRMSDGALIALRPNTEFSFEEYKYNQEDVGSSSSLLNLIKGGFRTITGFIGKHSKKNYRVKTAVATIGIRGTHYGLTLCQQGDCNEDGDPGIDDGLYGSVIDGEIFAENETGQHIFSNDEFFHVKSSTSKPRGLIKPPGVVFGQAKRNQKLKKMGSFKKGVLSGLNKHRLQRAGMLGALTLIQNKQEFLQKQILKSIFFESTKDTNLSLASLIEPASPGNKLVFTYFGLDTVDIPPSPFPVLGSITSDGTIANQFFLNSVAKENGLFIPVGASQVSNGLNTLSLGDAKVLEPRSIAIPGAGGIGWGRWSREYTIEKDGIKQPHVGQLHYIVATNTLSLAQLGGLTALGTKTYSTVGGTRATDLSGNIAANFATVNMTVDFLGSVAAPGITNFNIATNVGGTIYQGQTTGLTTFAAATTSGLILNGNTGGPCPTCTGQASLAFMGDQAQAAGTIYTITNGINAINGATILTQDP